MNTPQSESVAPTPIDTIGDRIRKARETRGLNQSELGRMVNMSSQAINLIESGTTKSPTPGNLLAIADALGVTMRELITGRASTTSTAELLFQIVEELPEEAFPAQLQLDLLEYRIKSNDPMIAREDAGKYLAWIDRIKQDMKSLRKRDKP